MKKIVYPMLMLVSLSCVSTDQHSLSSSEDIADLETGPFSKEEVEFGNQLDSHIRSRYESFYSTVLPGTDAGVGLIQNSDLLSFLNPVLGKLGAGYRLMILDTDQVQHFSLPNGTIFVSLGALMQTHNQHEIAGLLAHEMAAVKRKLLYKEAKRFPTSERVALTASFLLTKGFGVADELQLDVDAMYLMRNAGFEAGEYRRLLARWAEENAREQRVLGQTHPEFRRRVLHLEEWQKRSHWQEGQDIPPTPKLLKMWQKVLR